MRGTETHLLQRRRLRLREAGGHAHEHTAGEGAGKSETGRPGRRFLLIQVANDGDFDQDSGSGDIMWCLDLKYSLKFSSVQLLSHVQLFVTPWTATCQASLFITNSESLFKLMSIELVMPSNHLILCCPLLLLPSIFPASGSSPMGQFFATGCRRIGILASASVPLMNIQD